jgi:hypothetical protein
MLKYIDALMVSARLQGQEHSWFSLSPELPLSFLAEGLEGAQDAQPHPIRQQPSITSDILTGGAVDADLFLAWEERPGNIFLAITDTLRDMKLFQAQKDGVPSVSLAIRSDRRFGYLGPFMAPRYASSQLQMTNAGQPHSSAAEPMPNNIQSYDGSHTLRSVPEVSKGGQSQVDDSTSADHLALNTVAPTAISPEPTTTAFPGELMAAASSTSMENLHSIASPAGERGMELNVLDGASSEDPISNRVNRSSVDVSRQPIDKTSPSPDSDERAAVEQSIDGDDLYLL